VTEAVAAAQGEGDDLALRTARRDRVLDAAGAAGLDVLVLSRRDSVAYATGARGLWTAGTRPFGPAAVLAVAERTVHLLSTWDSGVPSEIGLDHLYGITWNPAVLGASLTAIAGFADARRIGVDTLSPGFARALGRWAPDAEVVPADDLLQAVRAVKLPGEVARIAAAVDVSRTGLNAAVGALGAGATDTAALGAALAAMGDRGATTPTSAPLVRTVAGGAVAGGTGDRLTHVDLGVLVDGYEGGLGATVAAAPDDKRVEAAADAHRRLVAACRPGATGADLAAVAAAVGASRWLVRGSGMGFEPPVVSADLGHAVTLGADSVLSVEVGLDGADGARHRRHVVVGEDAAEVL
jgi:Xaa-Pro aminopeptidase